MQPKSLVLLVLALGCGLVASIGITQVMANRGSKETLDPDVEKIFVALEEIPMGTPITVEMVKLEEWPKGKVSGALSQLEDVEDRLPRTRIYPGEPILEKKLLGKGASSSGADIQIPIGFRVVPVRVSEETGGAAMILPGNQVDVLVHVKVKTETRLHRTVYRNITKTILQDVKIFAVDSTWVLQPSEDGKTIRARTISLLLTPGQTERVALAAEIGKIFLALRSPEDDTQVELGPGVSVDDILGSMKMADEEDEEQDNDLDEEEEEPISDGFLEMLAGATPDAPEELQPAHPSRNWVMKVIAENKVSEVVFELEDEEPSYDSNEWAVSVPKEAVSVPKETEEPGSFSFWKLVTSPNPVSDTATDQPEEDRTAAPAESEQTEPVEVEEAY